MARLRRPARPSLRLACSCGKNLADAVLAGKHVLAFARPGVRQAEYQHGGALIDGAPYSFRWDCRCGRTWEIRGDRLDAIWQEHAETGGIVRLVLGHDVL